MSILKQLQKNLPANAQITEVKFEGSEIVIYTKNKSFFRNSDRPVRDIVRELKKRVEVRPDLSITMDVEKTKKA
ncbi:MAG: beta-CASP ribonuclease aCPSF1, partial [Candidatus Aenigmarchaeota archaeon]|nr:beta-CASP ribonuclease aCPSF1 [Candidatus Aenigmarchaeota archaeon]